MSDVPFIRKRKVVGAPDMDRVSTSYVERHNSTVRDQNRRFARKTRCHGKKIENHGPIRAVRNVGTTSFVSTIRSKPRPPSLPELPRRLGRSMSLSRRRSETEEAPPSSLLAPSARGRDEAARQPSVAGGSV